jgi:Tol biopolymer transport system component
MSPFARLGVLLTVAVAAVFSADSKRSDSRSHLKSVIPSGVPFYNISSDGRFFSFTLAGNLVVRDTATAQVRQLTDGNASESTRNSVFSPDGKHLAYNWFGTDQIPELRIMRKDGTGRRTVARYEGARSVSVAQWSRDGRYLLILLETGETSSQIALVGVRDGLTRVWKEWKQGFRLNANMHLSPDSRYVAYKTSPTDIHVVSVDGTDTPVVHATGTTILGWTSGGHRLLFATRPASDSDPWSISAISISNGRHRGAPEVITQAQHQIVPVGLIDDGKSFYGVISTKLRSEVYIVNIDPDTGKTGSTPILATKTSSGTPTYTPEWSPDGKYLMFSRPGVGGRNRALRILSLDTGDERSVGVQFTTIVAYNWARDNQIIVNGTDEKRASGFFKLNPETGDASFLGIPSQEAGFPVVSLDGKYVYYRSDRSRSLIKRNMETATETALYRTQPPYIIRGLRLSADGRQIAFVHASTATADRLSSEAPSGKSILVVSVQGGAAHEVLNAVSPEWFQADPIQGIEWSRDGRYIFFVKARSSGKQQPKEIRELWRIPAAGGEAQRTGLQMEGLGWPVMHPDGKKLAFVDFFLGRTEVWFQPLPIK